MRVLLVRLRPLGDVVFTTPVLSALRRHYREAHISYVVEPDAAPIVERNPHINELIIVPRSRGLARIADDVRMARQLLQGDYDLAIDFHGGPRSAWLTWASRATRRIGYTVPGRSWMYTQVVQRSRDLTPRHSVMNQWDLVAPLGIPALDPAIDPLQMPDCPQAATRVDGYLSRARVDRTHALIVVHVSASTRFKRWPEDSFISVVTGLVRQGTNRKIFLTSGPSDAEAAQRIAEVARNELGPLASAILDSQQLTLHELRALIGRAALFVGGDSGPLHIAATTSVPIVELLGPTLAERSFPWRDPHFYSEIIDPGELPCRPCHQRVCVPGDFRCLTSIRSDRVLAAAERALDWRVRTGWNDAHRPNERRIPVVH